MSRAMTRPADTQTIPVSFTLNGRLQEIDVEPNELLLDVVRDRLGLTGAKRSCDVQVCGACTLLVDGRPVSACTTLAFEVRGRSVMTIEGLADDGKLHPLQEAFIEYGGFQCGFCTPGMLLASKALLDENPNPTEEELKHFMHGNLCRCTGYKKIIESIMAAAKKMRGISLELTITNSKSQIPHSGFGIWNLYIWNAKRAQRARLVLDPVFFPPARD